MKDYDEYDDEKNKRNERKFKPDFEPKFDGTTWPKFNNFKSDMGKMIYEKLMFDNSNPKQDIHFTFIPFLSGRPNRELIINSDDIINLKIAFGIAKTINEFCLLV